MSDKPSLRDATLRILAMWIERAIHEPHFAARCPLALVLIDDNVIAVARLNPLSGYANYERRRELLARTDGNDCRGPRLFAAWLSNKGPAHDPARQRRPLCGLPPFSAGLLLRGVPSAR
jgi:hypothetical protein